MMMFIISFVAFELAGQPEPLQLELKTNGKGEGDYMRLGNRE